MNILKIHEIFCENPRIIFVVFYDVHKENMFTTNLEDGRLEFLVIQIQDIFENVKPEIVLKPVKGFNIIELLF